MKTELAISLDRKFRLIENNFWFIVERHTFKGWRQISKGRSRETQMAALESTYRVRKQSVRGGLT